MSSQSDQPSFPYWNLPAEELLKRLATTSQGITQTEAKQRLVTYGHNTIVSRHKVTAIGTFLSQFNNPIIFILLFATVISAFVGDYADAIIILIIILGSAILSFIQEYNAGNAAEKLRSKVSLKCHVVRNGQEVEMPAEEIVPGDVVLISAGSLIPGDGVVLESRECFANQSVLTGETFPVEKEATTLPVNAGLAERVNCVFMGTNVSSGSARVVIVETGAHTAFGQIADRLSLRPPETEFERGIRRFGALLSEVTLILVIVVFAINVFTHKPPVDSLLFSIALAVGLTPQLLPAIININLSKGSQAMAANGVIVRRLAAIENFGSMDILCTDKTGTLTAGVVRLDGAMDTNGQPSQDAFRLAFLNSHFQTGMVNPLDQAVTSAGTPDISACQKLDEIPYDFTRKRLSVVVKEGNEIRLITKGAYERVLEVCTDIQMDGGTCTVDSECQDSLKKLYVHWSAKGYRVLGIASKLLAEQPVYERNVEQGMTFNGFLLFFDPPKPDVVETLADLKNLGVEVKIITGDNHLVAMHTAEQVGLEVKGVLTGAELGDVRDEALWHMAEKTTLFTEVDPNQKERIILALHKMGHVVGYMGDGINDAPSLHAADVGISVDTAVDVAKEAADFVLLKHDLAVLHQGILQGRTTFANTLKYVFMATSANFGNMFSVAGASIFLPFLPMLPKQILLINFMTDLPEMTIATDRVDDIVIRYPRRWDIAFIRRFMFIFGLLSSVFDFITFGALFLLAGTLHPIGARAEALFHTGWFVESVLSATLVVFVLRTRLPFYKSRPSRAMVLATAGVILAVFLFPYSPLAGIMSFVALPPQYLFASVLIALVYFVCAEGVKRWFYAREDR